MFEVHVLDNFVLKWVCADESILKYSCRRTCPSAGAAAIDYGAPA